jgi:predicted TIM-barrel fold metal-dependent hydrolase
LCFGHFGGEDEFARYFEQDRFDLSNQLTKDIFFGIDFLRTTENKPSLGKPEQLWKFTDWYSIICSLMLQHPNVYADISYILHDSTACLPLLRQTLQHPELKKKVLFGTDFFVVRNHKSDKNLLADMYRGLSEAEFDLIARHNPAEFLKKK